MNDKIKQKRINNLDKCRDFVVKKIDWDDFIKDNNIKTVYNKKSNYKNRTMKEYNPEDLIQQLSFKYYEEYKARMKLINQISEVKCQK
jgi:hypothetical protein